MAEERMGTHSAYKAAFANDNEPFLKFYDIAPDKSLAVKSYTRGEFWSLALKAANQLQSNGLSKGDCVLHVFSGNRLEDLAFRLAGCMLGTVPVTVNWQADDAEKVKYKAELTEAKLAIVDLETSPEFIKVLEECGVSIYDTTKLCEEAPLSEDGFCSDLSSEDTKMIIFTSGTTGQPKGVESSFKAYDCNTATFENFLQLEDPTTPAIFVVINPMHHTNSSAITDWALRRPGCCLHLCLRYSTAHWGLLGEITQDASLESRVICPMVSRHFDFMAALVEKGQLKKEDMLQVFGKAEPLIGSAPVGPTTVERLQTYGGRLPHVRFGSTETCLQVIGTPMTHTEEDKLAAFQAGWNHTWQEASQVGYYIGRHHAPHTRAKVVKSINKDDANYMVEVAEGEPGCLICQGDNVMTRYVKNPEATEKAIHTHNGEQWYTAFGDICYFLKDKDGGENIYWQSRDSAMLIRGGANYAYEQIQAEIKTWIEKTYDLSASDFDVAVVGVNLESEHENECYLTVELKESAEARKDEIETTLLTKAKDKKGGLSKAACPQFLRIDTISKNFKGAILYSELKAESLKHFDLRKS